MSSKLIGSSSTYEDFFFLMNKSLFEADFSNLGGTFGRQLPLTRFAVISLLPPEAINLGMDNKGLLMQLPVLILHPPQLKLMLYFSHLQAETGNSISNSGYLLKLHSVSQAVETWMLLGIMAHHVLFQDWLQELLNQYIYFFACVRFPALLSLRTICVNSHGDMKKCSG